MIIKKLKPTPPEPEHGDFKCTTHFAFFPTKIKDEVIWLEFYNKWYVFQIKERFLGWIMVISADWDYMGKEKRHYGY